MKNYFCDAEIHEVASGAVRHRRQIRIPPPLSDTKWDLRRFPILRISFKNYLNSIDRATQERLVAHCATVRRSIIQVYYLNGPISIKYLWVVYSTYSTTSTLLATYAGTTSVVEKMDLLT